MQNIGTIDTLMVSGVNITGAAASDYSIISEPDTIPNNSAGDIVIEFDPAADGTRAATLEITSNDSNESPYLIELFGVGGDYASEPSAQASTITFSNITSWSMDATIGGSGT